MGDSMPSEALRQAIGFHFVAMGQQTRRDYAGFSVGNRRKLSIAPYIAREIANRVLQRVILTSDEIQVASEDIAKRVEAVLLAFPEDDAFRVASRDSTEAEAARGELTFAIMIDLLKTYNVVCVAPPAPISPSAHNGWKMWEIIRTDEHPAYNWKRTWLGRADDDFIGFDGAVSIGRVFRIGHIHEKDKWFWLLGYPGIRLDREGPASGWEETLRAAACRVERCYKSVMERNRAKSA